MDIKIIKQLREETGVSIADCKKALEEAKEDLTTAKKLLSEWGIAKASKKGDRQITAGLVESYIHAGGKVGSLISLGCETDFVARTEEFKNLAHEIAMQVASMNPKNAEELFKQSYIRDQKIHIEDLIKQAISKLGENIQITAMSRQAF